MHRFTDFNQHSFQILSTLYKITEKKLKARLTETKHDDEKNLKGFGIASHLHVAYKAKVIHGIFCQETLT